MILSTALDFIDDSDYTHWLQDEVIAHGAFPSFDDLTVYECGDEFDTDTDIYCEYQDIDGAYGFGVIKSWHTNPYDVLDIETDENCAYIQRDNGGTTYAHLASLIPLAKVTAYDSPQSQLSDVFPTAPDTWDTRWEYSPQDVYKSDVYARGIVAQLGA